MVLLKEIRHLIETGVFGVCSRLADKMGIASQRVRLWFVYISFLGMGSPVILYMILAFWMNLKRYVRDKVSPLRDL